MENIKPYIYLTIFTNKQYLVLLTMPPRNRKES